MPDSVASPGGCWDRRLRPVSGIICMYPDLRKFFAPQLTALVSKMQNVIFVVVRARKPSRMEQLA
jgi:hypothetical protein